MHIERNQLSRVSLGFSPLVPAHPREWQLTIGFGPPPCFRKASAWPGLDRRASDRTPVTDRPFRRRATFEQYALSLSLRLPARAVNLATEVNSLPHFSKRTSRRRNPRLAYSAFPGNLPRRD